jgi:hypothetical protein
MVADHVGQAPAAAGYHLSSNQLLARISRLKSLE